MSILVSGLLIFFVLHFYSTFRSREPAKDIKRKMGEKAYMGAYSLISALGLGLIIWGYKQAGVTEQFFTGFDFDYSLRLLLMLLAFIFLVAANLPAGYIKSTLKHPMLVGVCIWSITHLIDGATERQALLFGSFLIYSVIDIVVVSSRASSSKKSTNKIGWKNDAVAIVIGIVAYGVTVIWLHAGLSITS